MSKYSELFSDALQLMKHGCHCTEWNDEYQKVLDTVERSKTIDVMNEVDRVMWLGEELNECRLFTLCLVNLAIQYNQGNINEK